MRWTAIALAVLFSFGIARAQLTDAGKQALPSLEGDWQAVSIEIDGQVNHEPNFPRITVEGDKFLLNGEDLGLRISLLDASSSPALLDISHAQTGGVIECIYELNDDTWRVCANMDAQGIRQRPTEFKTPPGSKYWVVIYKRLSP